MTRNRFRLATVTVPLLIAVSLTAGCTEQQRNQSAEENAVELYRHVFHHGKWKQLPRPLEPQVESVSIGHTVEFAGGATGLSDRERSDLHAFLREKGIAENEVIVLDAPRSADGMLDGAAVTRIGEIKAELARTGLKAIVASKTQPNSIKPARDQVAVVVTRTMVIPPDCKTEEAAPGDKPNYVFSCANTANLGQMIADPQDLVEGRVGSYSDGTVGASAIDRYRSRDTEGIQIESTE